MSLGQNGCQSLFHRGHYNRTREVEMLVVSNYSNRPVIVENLYVISGLLC